MPEMYLPSPSIIRREAAKIRKEWDEMTEYQRRADDRDKSSHDVYGDVTPVEIHQCRSSLNLASVESPQNSSATSTDHENRPVFW